MMTNSLHPYRPNADHVTATAAVPVVDQMASTMDATRTKTDTESYYEATIPVILTIRIDKDQLMPDEEYPTEEAALAQFLAETVTEPATILRECSSIDVDYAGVEVAEYRPPAKRFTPRAKLRTFPLLKIAFEKVTYPWGIVHCWIGRFAEKEAAVQAEASVNGESR